MVKYRAGSSLGSGLAIGPTRTVLVTGESLDISSGYEGDLVTYTATVLDNKSDKINAAFVASLKIDSVVLVGSQVFDSAVYNQTTGLLTLTFTIPVEAVLVDGSYTVFLEWAEQII